MNVLNDIIDWILSKRLLYHFLFWMIFGIGTCIYGLGYGLPIIASWYFLLIELPVQILASYLFIYWQMPLLFKKRYWLFALVFIVPTYLLYLLIHFNQDYGFGVNLITGHKPHAPNQIFTDLSYYFRYMVTIYWVVFVVAGIKMVKSHFETRRLVESLEAQKWQSEYQLIQSQLQPKFMLQAIQFIQEQTTKDPDNATEAIANVSDILDYVLYQSKQQTVTLDQEMDKMITYASLYGASSKGKYHVNVDKGNTGNGLKIIPMTLVNLVEKLFTLIELRENNAVHIEGVVLGVEGNCILQLTLNNLNTSIDQKVLVDSLDGYYHQAYGIDLSEDSNKTELQITIEL